MSLIIGNAGSVPANYRAEEPVDASAPIDKELVSNEDTAVGNVGFIPLSIPAASLPPSMSIVPSVEAAESSEKSEAVAQPVITATPAPAAPIVAAVAVPAAPQRSLFELIVAASKGEIPYVLKRK